MLRNSLDVMILVFFQKVGKWRWFPVSSSLHERRRRIPRICYQPALAWLVLDATA